MKLNILYKFITVAIALSCFAACDYLEIVPEEQPALEDAYQRPEQTLGYLYSCYNGLESWNPVSYQNEDVASTDEYVLPVAGNWNLNAYNIQTNQRSSASGGDWHWRYCGYVPIRTCHLFMEIVDEAPKLTDEQRRTWKAEAKALVAIYHFMVLRKYGPCPIMDHAYDTNIAIEDMPGRSHYDKVTAYIVKTLDEAIPDLPDRWTEGNWGRIDKVVAKAMKARVLVYAASPLWNGNTLYESGKFEWKNVAWEDSNYGKQLVNPVYSRQKWVDAELACREALNFAESQGLALYENSDFDELRDLPESFTDEQRDFMKYVFRLRYALLSRPNASGQCREVVWGTAGQSNTLVASIPRRLIYKTDGQWWDGWSGIAPTSNAVNMFYTQNGKPITKDNNFYSQNDWLKIADDAIVQNEPSYSGNLMKGEIINLHTKREPRFYAWLAFNGGEFGTKVVEGEPLIVEFRNDQLQGYNPSISARDYCRTGYLCQKWIHPSLSYSRNNANNNESSLGSQRPLIRMAELYLNLAECEAALENTVGFLSAINPVRTRAGIPALTQADLTSGMTAMDWVRNERFIEFFGEGIRFYDIRRWMEGEKAYGNGFQGFDMISTQNPSKETFNRFVTINEYQDVAWDDRMYVMPLFFNEVDQSDNLVQAPGY